MHALLPPFPSMLLCPPDPQLWPHSALGPWLACSLSWLPPSLLTILRPSQAWSLDQTPLWSKSFPQKSFPDFPPICDHFLFQTPRVFVQIPLLVFVIICLLHYLPIYSFTLCLFNISQQFLSILYIPGTLLGSGNSKVKQKTYSLEIPTWGN